MHLDALWHISAIHLIDLLPEVSKKYFTCKKKTKTKKTIKHTDKHFKLLDRLCI